MTPEQLVEAAEAKVRDAERKGYASVRLERARQAAERLLDQERNHSGSGRNGHLSEADLVPLFEALGPHLRKPDSDERSGVTRECPGRQVPFCEPCAMGYSCPAHDPGQPVAAPNPSGGYL